MIFAQNQKDGPIINDFAMSVFYSTIVFGTSIALDFDTAILIRRNIFQNTSYYVALKYGQNLKNAFDYEMVLGEANMICPPTMWHYNTSKIENSNNFLLCGTNDASVFKYSKKT